MVTRKAALTFGLSSIAVLTLTAFIFGEQQPAKADICDRFDITCRPSSPALGRSGTAPASSTTLRLCNQTPSTVYAAYSFWAGNEGWRSAGWYQIQGQNCSNLSLGSYSGDTYVYAEGSNGGRWSGRDANFCITRGNAFNIANSDRSSCNDSGQARVGMTRFRLNRGATNTYNFRVQ
ncbi:DUF1036 domain-containing protein [Leptolyngbya sp. FACHB-711]|uniref:DUF1036 domain-containing protein n=1 Tax=Leptolyngbya sp. FACHB-711 TaxID=2692813 RepID=UPI0016845873|nr:DUF1036 domain-containing protein [Leptolyngbya sp. FACHB-711]MBD2025871.1 DUF1036 domain-containing protein [Leptolyngbya sp. FACHB-711]